MPQGDSGMTWLWLVFAVALACLIGRLALVAIRRENDGT